MAGSDTHEVEGRMQTIGIVLSLRWEADPVGSVAWEVLERCSQCEQPKEVFNVMWCLHKAQVLDRLSTDSLGNRGSYGDYIPNLLFLPFRIIEHYKD